MLSQRSIRNLLVAVLAFVLGAVACQPSPAMLHGSPYQHAQQSPDFTLVDHHGDTFQVSAHRGKTLLLFFGYTHCPDVCPATLGDMGWIFDRLGEGSERALFAFVTVDPDRDTPEALAEYMSRFPPEFFGLSGEPEVIEAIKADYGIFSEIDPESDPQYYLVTHTARVFLIDPAGMLRTSYPFGTAREEIYSDIQAILKE